MFRNKKDDLIKKISDGQTKADNIFGSATRLLWNGGGRNPVKAKESRRLAALAMEKFARSRICCTEKQFGAASRLYNDAMRSSNEAVSLLESAMEA